MSRLVLPESVRLAERMDRAMEEADHIIAEQRYWVPKLHDIDARLNLRKARAQAGGPGIVPGFWHITRLGEGGAPTAWAITTGGLGLPGEYREMGWDVLETLKRGDHWNRNRLHEAGVEARRREESRERAKETRKEARVDDLAVNIRALMSPGVSMSDTGWTYKKNGRRGRKQA